MLEYWILVTRDAHGATTSLFSPDLKKELLNREERLEQAIHVSEDFDFRSYTKRTLTKELTKRKKVILPKRFEQLENITISPFQHWERFIIDPKKERSFLRKGMPIAGQIFNIVAILTNIFITFMALKIAAHNSDEDSTQSTSLAIAGAIFNSVINLALYILSGASATLEETGTRLDNLCRREDEPLAESCYSRHCSQANGEYIALLSTAGACISANAFITAVRLSLEYTLLADKYLSLDPDLSESEHHRYYELIKFLAIVPHIAAISYTSTAFQSSFARILISMYTDKKAREEEQRIPPGADGSVLALRLNQATEALTSQRSRSDRKSFPAPYESLPVIQFGGNAGYQQLDRSDDSPTSKMPLSSKTNKNTAKRSVSLG